MVKSECNYCVNNSKTNWEKLGELLFNINGGNKFVKINSY